MLAALALSALLGLSIAGCHPLTARGPQCLECMKASCSPEIAACDASSTCECLTRCYARDERVDSASIMCPRACGRTGGIYTAQAACMTAHCGEVCARGGAL